MVLQTLTFFTCCVVSQPDGSTNTHFFHLLCGQPTRWFYTHSLFSPAVWSACQMVLQTFSQPTRWFYKHSLFSPAVWSANQMVFTLTVFTCCVVSQPDGVYTHFFHSSKQHARENNTNVITASTECSKSVVNKCDYLPGDLHCSAEYMA